MEAEDWEAVKNTCEQALLDFPGNPEFTSQLGYALLIIDDYLGAIRAFEQCVAKEYEVARSLLFIGRAYDRMGNQAHAIEVLSKAAATEPKQFHALADIADINLDRRDYDEAIRWAKKSLKANRHFLVPIATLSAVHIIRREDEKVVSLIKTIKDDRREYLREHIEERLNALRQKGYKSRLNAIFRIAAEGG